jgi:hypothetical protein
MKTRLVLSVMILACIANNAYAKKPPTEPTPVIADDVICDGCVDSADISDGAVTSQKLSPSLQQQNSQLDARVTTLENQSTVPVYDYRNYYGSSVEELVFDTKINGSPCDTEIHRFVRIPQLDGSVIVERRVIRDDSPSGMNCFRILGERIQRATDDTFTTERINFYDSISGALSTYRVYDNPLILLTSSMREGATFASAVTGTNTDTFSGFTEFGITSAQITAVGIEDVTVPAGAFNNCLKLVDQRQGTLVGNWTRTNWLCPGIGLTKRMQATDTSVRFLELRSYTLTP